MKTRVFAFASAFVVALAGASLAAQSATGTYRGVLVCEKFKNAPDILRAPLDVAVSGSDVRFGRPLFNYNGTRTVGTELASGMVDGDGKLQLKSSWTAGELTFQAVYDGSVTANGGTFSGTQTWSGPGDASGHRTCAAAIVPAPTASPQSIAAPH